MRGLAFSLVLALLLTACGGGDDPRLDIGPPDCRGVPDLCI